MIRASLITAGFLTILFFLYVFRVFPLRSYILVYIFFPISIALLVSTLLWKRDRLLKNVKLKFGLLLNFVVAVALLNIVIPKHAILGWAFVIVLANHYFSKKAVTMTYAVTMFLMLWSLYLALFYGEYDANLLGMDVKLNVDTGLYEAYAPEGFAERVDFLSRQIDAGDNRYVKVLVFYYLPRAAVLTLIYLSCYQLNGRMWKMLVGTIDLSERHEKMEAELNLAAQIQIGALPIPIACGDGFDVLADIVPAREVGGDLYYYFRLDKEHVGLLIGDVSDKGAPAAMFMMQAITCFRAFANATIPPSETLKQVNSILCERNERGMFITCFYGILHTRTGQLVYANAGHNPPAIGHFGHFEFLKCSAGFVLGALKTVFVKDEIVILKKGDILIMYTDGITEAKNPENELYGETRLLDVLNRRESGTVLELFYDLKKDVYAFCKNAEQSDDRTFLLIQFHGDDIDNEEAILPTNSIGGKKAHEFVAGKLNADGLNTLSEVFANAASELLKRIAEGAFEDDGQAYIRVTYNRPMHEVSMVFADKGKPFNPLDFKPENETETPGSLALNSLLEGSIYQRTDDLNAVILRKPVL